MLGGYIIGSLGIGLILEMIDQANKEADQIIPPTNQLPVIDQKPRPQPKPFEFASWDDEEDR